MYITEAYVHSIRTGLRDAVNKHRDEFSFGMDSSQLRANNDRIGSFLGEADFLVRYLNQWPNRQYICNDTRIASLS